MDEVEFCLACERPYAQRELFGFLRLRALPGVEVVEATRLLRSFRIGADVGTVEVRWREASASFAVTARCSSASVLPELRARLARLFDVDAEIAQIDARLSSAKRFRAHVVKVPGLRVPGTMDGFETAVRTILGQQVSVKGATTMAARIVDRWGTPLPAALISDERVKTLFPSPEALATAPLTEIGLTRARTGAIQGLAEAFRVDPSLLEFAPAQDAAEGEVRADAAQRLQALRGIGPWTAQYIAMRVFKAPDAWPSGDLVLRKAISKNEEKPRASGEVEKALEGCRPYRAYATLRLWAMESERGT